MAIKGKGKTKGRAPARAPRRTPVEVPVPFFLRRRVQVTIALVVGILMMMLAVWVTNGLRRQREDDERNAQAADQRAAGQAWKGEVEATLGAIGTLSQGPPILLPAIGDAIDALDKGKVPEGAVETLQTAQDDATTASEAIEAYALVDEIRNKGMTEGQANYFLNSQARIGEGLDLYRQAAAVAELAAGQTAEEDRKPLVKRAKELKASAELILGEGWSDYQQALLSVQIIDSPALPTGG